MLFRRPKSELREGEWRTLAARLDLSLADGAQRMLEDQLGAGAARIGPVYTLAVDEDGRLFLGDYIEEQPHTVHVVTVAMLRLKLPRRWVSLKASRKLHKVLERLGASATGGKPVTVPFDPAFGERVTVYARESDQARRLLTAPVRRLLTRALCEREVQPTFLMGESHLLLSNRAGSDAPTPLPALEAMLGDLLGLYAALTAASGDAD